MSKDGKEQAKNSHLAEGIECVYSSRKIRRFKIMLNMKGDFFFSWKKCNILYQVSEVMAWRHDWNLHGGELRLTK